VVSPHAVVFQGRANRVILPGEQGVFEVLPFHRPLVSRLLTGLVVIDDQAVPIQRGIVKVDHNHLTAIIEQDPASASSA